MDREWREHQATGCKIPMHLHELGVVAACPLPDEAFAEARRLAAEWRRLGEEEPQTQFQVAYRAALRKCADELEGALRGDR